MLLSQRYFLQKEVGMQLQKKRLCNFQNKGTDHCFGTQKGTKKCAKEGSELTGLNQLRHINDLGGEKFWQVCQRVFRGNLGRFFIFLRGTTLLQRLSVAIIIRKTTGEVDECNLSAQLEKKNAIFVIFSKFPLHKVPQHTATVKSQEEINFSKLRHFEHL